MFHNNMNKQLQTPVSAWRVGGMGWRGEKEGGLMN